MVRNTHINGRRQILYFISLTAMIVGLVSLPIYGTVQAERPNLTTQNERSALLSWADYFRRYRLPVSVGSGSASYQNKIAELAVDFTDLLASVGSSSAFDSDSLRMVEVDAAGTVIDPDIPFQFDPDPGYDAATTATGNLIWLVPGPTPASTTRYFQLYFDDVTNSPYTPMTVTPLVELTDGVTDEGFASLKITNNNATFFYHKSGGGFSSLIDANNNDWINHSSAAGSAGDYRGIPNMVHPNDGGYFHPGRTTATTQIVNQGPLKATFSSTAAAGAWEVSWSVYPDYATLTVQQAAGNYWFLYEGTPGGAVDANDTIIRSSNQKTDITTAWTGDLSPEWLLFSDEGVGRSLFYAHHADDSLVDSYYLMESLMTVFGFGRSGGMRYLTGAPNQLTIGLTTETTFSGAQTVINNATTSLAVVPSDPQSNPSLGSTQNIALSPGWNLISSHIAPAPSAIDTVLADIGDNLVIIKNGIGEVYWPGMNVNSIHNWAVADGFYVYMDTADTLTLTGAAVDPGSTPIQLSAGWNTVAYFPDTTVPVDQALAGISSELIIVKDGFGNLYWPVYAIDQLGSMQPGSGYEMYVSAPTTLLYP